ncbi:MAG TPA: TIR domain-containing protein [Chitinophagaceae bacterium]|nr:TIR domain-containing protein [Chitinophagaceae bacterium]
MAQIFISYSDTDKSVVKRLSNLLTAEGWSVWWDRQITAGKSFDRVIEDELKQSQCVVVLWNQRSVQSEWVLNEATEAQQSNKLVPVILEEVALPLAFKRTEAALLTGWKGDPNHPELEVLFRTIEEKLQFRKKENPEEGRKELRKYILGMLPLLMLGIPALRYLFRQLVFTPEQGIQPVWYMLVLICFSVTTVFACYLVAVSITLLRKKKPYYQRFRLLALFTGLILFITGMVYPFLTIEKEITVRVMDTFKKPVQNGEVKLKKQNDVRTQFIDANGLAVFHAVPLSLYQPLFHLAIQSPGFHPQQIDTVSHGMPLDIFLKYNEFIIIQGIVKTAAEIPISGVEVNVEGTRFATTTATDGSYTIRLEEYTIGDAVSLTTSHPDFEDKILPIRIANPEIKQDIFLNPVHSSSTPSP